MGRFVRVDELPAPVRGMHELSSRWAAAAGQMFMQRLLAQCSVSFTGYTRALLPGANVVLAIWHETLILYFMVFGRHMENHVWMNHPAWFMRPVHLMLEAMDIRYVLGSSGHGGRHAADEVVHALRGGASTTVAVDGPAGPVRLVKSGCLHMAAQAGVELVPMSFEVDRVRKLWTWDRKLVPVPGARIRVHLSEPLHVSDPADPVLKERLVRGLG